MRLFLVGLLALLCQVVLLRELNVAFYGVELVYAVALAAWMAGGAAGAAFLPRRFRATPGRLNGLLAATAVSLPAEVAVIRVSRLALGGVAGAYLPFEQQLLVLAAARAAGVAGARRRFSMGRRTGGGAGALTRLGVRRRKRRRGCGRRRRHPLVRAGYPDVHARGPRSRVRPIRAPCGWQVPAPASCPPPDRRRHPPLPGPRPPHDRVVAPVGRRLPRLPVRTDHRDVRRLPDGAVCRRCAGVRERDGEPRGTGSHRRAPAPGTAPDPAARRQRRTARP